MVTKSRPAPSSLQALAGSRLSKRFEEGTTGVGSEPYIIDDREGGVFRVNRRTFTDPEILAQERERLFDRSWVYVGHESEVSEPGDFQSRSLGTRSLILVRGTDGEVRVFLNTCTHRGAQVCREPRGNKKSFQCFYHGWTFSNEGRLIGVPGEEAYGPAFERSALGLGRPPRTESYRGFVFVSFDAAIESLEEYLGDAREYLDLVVDQSEAGMEITGGTQRYGIRANWKLLCENSIDGYHAATTHARYMRFLSSTGGASLDLISDPGLGAYARSLGNGHAVMEYPSPWGRPIAHWAVSFGEETKAELEQIERRLAELHGVERAKRIAHMSRNLLIFPNLVINDIMAITVRTFFPIAPDEMSVSAWNLAPVDEKPDARAMRFDNFLTFLGPGGFATPDDVEALESCQRGFANREVGWSDISREMNRADPMPTGELQMRTFWRRWNELLTSERSEQRVGVRRLTA